MLKHTHTPIRVGSNHREATLAAFYSLLNSNAFRLLRCHTYFRVCYSLSLYLWVHSTCKLYVRLLNTKIGGFPCVPMLHLCVCHCHLQWLPFIYSLFTLAIHCWLANRTAASFQLLHLLCDTCPLCRNKFTLLLTFAPFLFLSSMYDCLLKTLWPVRMCVCVFFELLFDLGWPDRNKVRHFESSWYIDNKWPYNNT